MGSFLRRSSFKVLPTSELGPHLLRLVRPPPNDGLPIKAQEYVAWEEAAHTPGLAERIRWGRLKRLTRVFEKLSRSYRNDVSRLVDLARQQIVFDSVRDLTLCLGTMICDEDIHLVSVKNRMDLDYDSARSAGYRDVNVLFRFKTPEATEMGCETHVCEVQLVLRRVADLKNDEGHHRYIIWRNARGC